MGLQMNGQQLQYRCWLTVLAKAVASVNQRGVFLMHKIFVFVILSMTIMIVGAEEVKPVFHATFEHDFRAVTSAGVIAGKHKNTGVGCHFLLQEANAYWH